MLFKVHSFVIIINMQLIQGQQMVKKKMQFYQDFNNETLHIYNNSQGYQCLGTKTIGLDCLITFQDGNVNSFLPFQLFWTIHFKDKLLQCVQVRPAYVERFGVTLKADNFYNQVGFLQLIADLNHDEQYWTTFVAPDNQFSIRNKTIPWTTFSFKAWWRIMKQTAIAIFQKITLSLAPYSLEPVSPAMESQMCAESEDKDLMLYKSILTLACQIEVKNAIENRKNIKIGEIITAKRYNSLYKQILVKSREKVMKRHQNVLKIFGYSDKDIWKKCTKGINFNKIQDDLSFDSERDEVDTKVMRNVQGVKWVKIKRQQKIKYGDGDTKTHCDLFKVDGQGIPLHSVNQETNENLEMRRRNEEPLQEQLVELEVVLKTRKNKESNVCVNSFLNEMKFMSYIRNMHGCEYISNFKMELLSLSKEGRIQNQHFFLDYYPNTFWTYLQRGVVSLREILRILLKVSQAMLWLSKKGILHRDIKPENIMIDKNGDPKVIDFGSCCSSTSEKGFQSQSNQFNGTKGYFPPCEDRKNLTFYKTQIWRHPLSDVYSFGAMIQNILGISFPVLGAFGQSLQHLCRLCKSLACSERPDFKMIINLLTKAITYVEACSRKVQK